MKMKLVCWTVLAVFLLGALVAGCSVRQGSMTAISTRNVELDKVDLDTMPQVKGVTGKDSRMIFLFIPLGLPTVQGAVDDALTQGKGDLIIDGVLRSEYWTMLLFGQQTISITGNVINTKEKKQ